MRRNRSRGMLSIMAMTLTATLCAGCLAANPTPSKTPAGFGSIPDKVVRLAVPQTMADVYHQGALAFAREVALQSGERLYVEVTMTYRESVGSLSSGETDFSLLAHDALESLSPDMACVGLPFFYDSAEHIAMALNTETVIQQLRDSVQNEGVYPLTAFSGSQTLMVSSQGHKLSVYDFNGAVVFLEHAQPVLASALESVGSIVRIGERGEGQLSRVYSDSLNTPPEGDLAEVDMETLLNWQETERPLSVMWSMHRSAPKWLVADKEFWEGLSDWELSVYQEAAAAMAGYVENELLQQREDFTLALERRGITINRLLRQDFGNVLYGEGALHWLDRPLYFDQSLYDHIQSCG